MLESMVQEAITQSVSMLPLGSGGFQSEAVVFGVLGIVGVIGIVFWAITAITLGQAQEKTKREVAAYVAEGSMSPEDAKTIIEAKQIEA